MKHKYSLAFLVAFILGFQLPTQAQQPVNEDSLKHPERYQRIDLEDFNSKLLETIVLEKINIKRAAENYDSLVVNTILQNAAEDQAMFMAAKQEATLLQKGKKKTTGKRIQYYGGSTSGDEVVTKMSPKKGKFLLTYNALADNIVFKLFKGKKTMRVLMDPKYIFAGVAARLDEPKKKVYLSIVVGNYDSFNGGITRRDEMDLPYTTKKYGLKPKDKKICRKTKKFKGLHTLQQALYVKNNKIYFDYPNMKKFKKLIRDNKDGLAVDIVQRSQFDCSGDNIVDNSLVNRGIMLKRVWARKLYKKNMYEGKAAKKKIKVLLGELPEGLEGDYELNLIVIKSKHVCANIQPVAKIEGDVEYQKKLEWLADTVLGDSIPPYKVEPETKILTFKIPFEKSKYEYRREDIEPFIEKLNEPDFIVNEIKIYAYSSIEGSDRINQKLQKKRAESILEAIKSRQKQKIKPEIITDYNWNDFVKDLQGTEYENLTQMTLKEAQKYIRDHHLAKKLEPWLKEHRYALIEMHITYDVSTPQKEQKYVVSRFNMAVENMNRPKALAIQKYIFKKVIAGTYDSLAVTQQNIPEKPAFAGLIMNKLWLLKYLREDDIDENYCKKINILYHLDKQNFYIKYNYLLCSVLNKNLANEDTINWLQTQIDSLYEKPISKKTIDNLNLEFQMRVIEAIDTTDKPSKLVMETLNKIKELVNIKEDNDWQNALKLSYLFIQAQDYDFAAKILEPFIYDKNVFEELLYNYILLCTYSDARIFSNKFAYAMTKLEKMNHDRFCDLINKKIVSFQIFRNTRVKDLYCSKCKQKN